MLKTVRIIALNVASPVGRGSDTMILVGKKSYTISGGPKRSPIISG